MPDPNFVLPAGGFGLFTRFPNVELALTLFLPVHQRSRLYAVGVGQSGQQSAGIMQAVFSSKTGTIATLELGLASGAIGFESYQYFSPVPIENSFGPDDVLTIAGDGGGSDARILELCLLFMPG